MTACEVLVVGGGPAGSSCAWWLRRAGVDVVVMDRAAFPRDKLCAGWITPQVVADLAIDADEYRRGRTWQPVTGFRVGLIGGRRELKAAYDRAVSFGIRRCEFDDYLLRRTGARLETGHAATFIRREAGRWIVNGSIEAPMLVGAGGHFCPVARWLNPAIDGAPVVAAREAECEVGADCGAAPGVPELYFCRDLKGYGWCFRKGSYLTVGLGRLDSHSLPAATTAFVEFLEARGRVPSSAAWRWRGHAYLIAEPRCRRTCGDGVLLAGDAAGLAYPRSGEGIRPAIESGLLAAATILEARGGYARERLEAYDARLAARFDLRAARPFPAGAVQRLATGLFPWLLDLPWVTRHVLIDRWFLRAHEPALALP